MHTRVALAVFCERGHRPASQPCLLYKNCCFLGAGASVRMRSISKLLLPSFRASFPSSSHKSRRCRANSLHSKRMCLTVWFPCLHSHLPSSIPGTLRPKRNSRSPIFPARMCTTSELSSLLNPQWSLIIPILGAGSSLRNSRPRRSLVHSTFHSLMLHTCLLDIHWFLTLDCNKRIALGQVLTNLHRN